MMRRVRNVLYDWENPASGPMLAYSVYCTVQAGDKGWCEFWEIVAGKALGLGLLEPKRPHPPP